MWTTIRPLNQRAISVCWRKWGLKSVWPSAKYLRFNESHFTAGPICRAGNADEYPSPSGAAGRSPNRGRLDEPCAGQFTVWWPNGISERLAVAAIFGYATNAAAEYATG